MVTVEFRRIVGASRDSDVFLWRGALPLVPAVGEVINIEGHPYVVFQRGWAVGGEDSLLWCYIRLSPLQGAR